MARGVAPLAAVAAFLAAAPVAGAGLDERRLAGALARAAGRPHLSLLVADARRSRGDETRALTFLTTVELNLREAPGRREVRDADGLVYRAVPGRGYRFHPLASFGKLNAAVSRGDSAEAHTLAWALLARARHRGRALVWEYDFPSSGGRAPWTSGLAQAVAAQALARAGFVAEARRAYRAIPGRLLLRLPQGPWIRLSTVTRDVVLNAQLQAALSLRAYGRIARDPAATRLAERMRAAAQALFPRFDTGTWSTYALGGGASDVGYHAYVASLLWKLGWEQRALRFRKYWRLPPAVRPGGAAVAYPLPRDGHRDRAAISFWLSKEASVTVRVAGRALKANLGRGWQEVTWDPAGRRPGRYDVRLDAVDRAGNRTVRALSPVVVRRDRRPPAVAAAVRVARLHWRARDPGTPWVRLRLRLDRGGATRTVDLGRAPLRGSRRLPLPLMRTWRGTLLVDDSSGNRSRVALGRIGGLGRLPA